MAPRTPVSMISKLIFGREKSEVYKWVFLFRDVAGWVEDSDKVIMGSQGS